MPELPETAAFFIPIWEALRDSPYAPAWIGGPPGMTRAFQNKNTLLSLEILRLPGQVIEWISMN